MSKLKRAGLAAICAGAVALGAGAGPARALPPEPDFVLGGGAPLPGGGSLDGPCGAAVDSFGRLYVADYYNHAIHVFDSSANFLTQIVGIAPESGPCGLGVDNTGALYANVYHRSVEEFTPSSFPPGSGTTYASAGAIDPLVDPSHPTGVAVDRLSGNVYVNYRTYVAAYDSSGAPILDGGGEPLRIGEGAVGDGYGLAVSAFPGSVAFPAPTAGRLYVPDHADDTVRVFNSNPALNVADPVATIAGPPGRGFGSLRDSAVAVDRSSGEIYVADTLGPQSSHSPRATIYAFAPDGTADPDRFRLKYDVVDASPTGLAVDNSSSSKQGRVYVTDGNGAGASVIAYPRGSATSLSAPPLSISSSPGAGSALVAGPPAPQGAAPEASALALASSVGNPYAGASEVSQKGNLRVNVSGRLAPKRLPRRGTAPIAVSVGGRITTTDRSLPPRLEKLRIELNRNGVLDFKGLPTCRYSGIQPGSSSRALSSCRSALVGRGSFTANITLAGQEPYPTKGKLLVFHGTRGGKPVLYGHIYSGNPFATSFVIVFRVQRLGKGVYGVGLNAPLPKAMDAWGRLTGLEMTLSRRYSHKGRRHSFISAGCPAPKGFPGASFSLARTSFFFDDGKRIDSTLDGNCKVKG